MIRLGGSPYASRIPHTVATTVDTMTAQRTSARLCVGQKENDHQDAQGEADHGHSVQDPRGERHERRVGEASGRYTAPRFVRST